MDLWLQAALLVGGLVVGVAGVHVEQPAVMLVGFVPGALVGAAVLPTMVPLGASEVTYQGAVVVGGLFGGVFGANVAWLVWVFVHVLPGFLAGVFVSAPVLGVAPTSPSGPEAVVVFLVGVVGAMLAWLVHRAFVAVFTAAVGSALVNVAVLGERVYVPGPAAVTRNPVAELDAVAGSLGGLGVTFLGLAVVFALAQFASLAAESADA